MKLAHVTSKKQKLNDSSFFEKKNMLIQLFEQKAGKKHDFCMSRKCLIPLDGSHSAPKKHSFDKAGDSWEGLMPKA